MDVQFSTDKGQVRQNNEDYVGYFYNENEQLLALLADGMGGHNAGDVASKLLVSSLGELWEKTAFASMDEVTTWLTETIQTQNDHIYHLGETYESMSGMGTTLVALALCDHHVAIAHVGDSRAYRIEHGEIEQMTEDHSLVNELVRSGGITEEMAANHPRKNYLTRTVGMKGEVGTELSVHPIHGDEQYLLCSDGLTNMISDQHIAEILSQDTPLSARVKTLIDAANFAGGRDNITVLVVDFKVERGDN